MPNVSELARMEEEAQASDADTVLDSLQTRARSLGFKTLGDALDALDALRQGKMPYERAVMSPEQSRAEATAATGEIF